MNSQKMIEALKVKRELIAAQCKRQVDALNMAIIALQEVASLNGEVKAEVKAPELKPHRPQVTMVIRKRERAGMVLKRIGMKYLDVAKDAIRKAGRPVSTEEVWKHLEILSGKHLNRKRWMATIGVCLRRYAVEGKLRQVGRSTVGKGHMTLWNVMNASDLQGPEVLSADVK